MKIDWSNIGGVSQDFRTLTLKIVNKENLLMWEKRYSSRETFDAEFQRLMQRFSLELDKRKLESNNG